MLQRNGTEKCVHFFGIRLLFCSCHVAQAFSTTLKCSAIRTRRNIPQKLECDKTDKTTCIYYASKQSDVDFDALNRTVGDIERGRERERAKERPLEKESPFEDRRNRARAEDERAVNV